MAKSLNLCQFIGNLGQDPETRYMPSGSAVTNFSIGVSDDYKDKQSGQKVEQTEWVRCSAFGKLAEIAGEYLRKGSKVYVSGKWKTRKWQDQSGQDRYSTELMVDNLQMLDSRGEAGTGSARASANGDGGHRPATPPQPPQGGFDQFEDEIPFNRLGPEAMF